MAFKTPFHLQRIDVPHQRHEVNPTMTGRASHSLVDVYAVIEIDKIRKVMDLGPFYRLAGPPALANDLQILAVREKLRVAVHAGLC